MPVSVTLLYYCQGSLKQKLKQIVILLHNGCNSIESYKNIDEFALKQKKECNIFINFHLAKDFKIINIQP